MIRGIRLTPLEAVGVLVLLAAVALVLWIVVGLAVG